jgi:cobyrinic acid a,c-diamide synthase
MVGALPVDVDFTPRPQGHGYVAGRVECENPFLPVGHRFRGHEFHYAKLGNADGLPTAYILERGRGIGQNRDGITYKNVLAGFTHIHALGEPTWGERLVSALRSSGGRATGDDPGHPLSREQSAALAAGRRAN